MSKLPNDFVKAPAPQAKPRVRRSSRASLVSSSTEPARDPRELVVRLTDDEYQALEEARQQLVASGCEVSLEQMIHRVFAEWMIRARSVLRAATTPPAPERRDEAMLVRLRAFIAEPLRTIST